MKEIETKYNEWTDTHDNIEVLEGSYIPITERRHSIMTKAYDGEHTEEVIDTDYNMIVHYMITDEKHIERVTKGERSGVG